MPQDKPQVFNLDAVTSERDLTPFRFAWKGERYELPHVSAADVIPVFDEAVKGNLGEVQSMYALMMHELGPQAVALRKAGMPAYKFNALLQAWQDHGGVPPGGIAGLYALLSQFREEVEADLAETYPGTRLADLGTARLTWRRLGVLVRQLPRTARVVRAQRGPSPADWGTAEYLLAAIYDALNGANWQRASSGRRHPGSPPQPIPRPGERPRSKQIGRTTQTPDRVKAWLASFSAPPDVDAPPSSEVVSDGQHGH